MKFSCDNCQTRYSIGDEKVRGKVLKIRCKTCGSIVVVREQIPTAQGEASGYAVPQPQAQIAAAAGAQRSSQPPPPPPQSSSSPPPRALQWYVAIKGKQHGPASHEDIARLFREGKISERSYLWHDQLPSWTRMRELADFAGVLAEGQATRPPPPPPDEGGAEVVSLEAARAKQRQQQPPAPGPAFTDPFAALGPSPGGPHQQEAPRESTRVFIMQAGLHNRQTKHRLYAGIAFGLFALFVGVCVVDYQLDILGLKSVVDKVAVSTGIKEAPVDEGPGWDDVEADPALKCRLKPDPAACIKEETARIAVVKKARAKKIAAGGTGTLTEEDLKDAFGAAGVGSGTGDGGRAVAAVGSDGFIALGAGGPTEDDKRRALGQKAGPSGPSARVETPSVAGTTIDADNASKVVRDGQAGVQLCVENAMKNGEDIPGKVAVTLSIGLKGTVERAVMNNAVVQASPLGACLTGTMRKWKFAPPSEVADLEIPLILR